MAMLVTVVGPSECSLEMYSLAETIGKRLAERGATVICSGLRGTAEAVCKGAKSADGVTVGFLQGTKRAEANPYVDLPLATGTPDVQEFVMINSAQVVIAIGNGYDTIAKIGLAGQCGVPVVALLTSEIKAPDGTEPFLRAHNPDEAVEKAFSVAIE